MFGLFKNNYTDEKLYLALEKDGACKNQDLIQKAKQNNPQILAKFAWYYYNKNQRSRKAFAWFNKAALQNDNGAQFQLGYMYRKGYGVEPDNKLAIEWYKKAGSNGNIRAQFKAGEMYRYGFGTYRSQKQAEEWFKKAANNGNVDAMYNLGSLYRYGATGGVPQDIHTAIKWYTKAAEHEHIIAQYHLGEIYELNDEVKNLQQAINWYHKARFMNPHVKSKIKQLNEQGYYPKGDQKDDTREKKEKYQIDTDSNKTDAAIGKMTLGMGGLGHIAYTARNTGI